MGIFIAVTARMQPLMATDTWSQGLPLQDTKGISQAASASCGRGQGEGRGDCTSAARDCEFHFANARWCPRYVWGTGSSCGCQYTGWLQNHSQACEQLMRLSLRVRMSCRHECVCTLCAGTYTGECMRELVCVHVHLCKFARARGFQHWDTARLQSPLASEMERGILGSQFSCCCPSGYNWPT